MRFFDNHRGVTLVEQMVSLVLGSVVIASLCGFYRAELFHYLTQEARTGTLEDARGALDIMVRDLKNAGSWGAGSVPLETGTGDDPNNDADGLCNRVYAATPNMIHVQMDLNGNGNCSDLDPRENVRYEITGPTSTCPGVQIIRRNNDCLVANVSTLGGSLFTYFDATGLNLGTAPKLHAIKRVGIKFSVRQKHPNPKIGGIVASNLYTSVELRN